MFSGTRSYNLMNHFHDEDKLAPGPGPRTPMPFQLDRLYRMVPVTLSSLCVHSHITSLMMLRPSSDIFLVWSIASCLKFNYYRTSYFQSLEGTAVTSVDDQLRPGFLILSLQFLHLSSCLTTKKGWSLILHWTVTREKETKVKMPLRYYANISYYHF